ncbi:potassium transporter Trk [Microbacterium candidum]|uniref:Potassium transporter Trk n=1 Tax=Microbacterium candidum TaxID=3041922 RepID=A0ABT7MUN6_9MICO|nr:potassium transporter Trk [Microbacterium sp. ASV49]MDL9978150.1 potassium transporter Trk [Microbacterium sp. ASV49]
MSDKQEPAEEVVIDDGVETATVRRAPKYSVFLALGAALGVFVAMILTFAFDGQANPAIGQTMSFTQGQVFGFLALVCGVIGLALGGIIALIFERTLGRRTHKVVVDREEHLTID